MICLLDLFPQKTYFLSLPYVHKAASGSEIISHAAVFVLYMQCHV